MKRYLLDTSIVAFLFRGKYGIGQHLSELGAERCCVSDVTVVPFASGVDEYGRQKDRLVKMGR